MKRYPGINYRFRPKSYWETQTVEHFILKHVKGEFRRQELRNALREDCFKDIPDAILGESLSEELRRFVGRIHPQLMGGEYLPDFILGEQEIVRISLNSTTNDIISVRARPIEGGEIGYSIVDEYQGEFEFHLSVESSKRPLTLGQMARFLEESEQSQVPGGLILGFNIMNAEYSSAEEMRGFTSISSDFYPGLGDHCERVVDDWIKEAAEDSEED